VASRIETKLSGSPLAFSGSTSLRNPSQFFRLDPSHFQHLALDSSGEALGSTRLASTAVAWPSSTIAQHPKTPAAEYLIKSQLSLKHIAAPPNCSLLRNTPTLVRTCFVGPFTSYAYVSESNLTGYRTRPLRTRSDVKLLPKRDTYTSRPR